VLRRANPVEVVHTAPPPLGHVRLHLGQ
jgi:hypothetical protein